MLHRSAKHPEPWLRCLGLGTLWAIAGLGVRAEEPIVVLRACSALQDALLVLVRPPGACGFAFEVGLGPLGAQSRICMTM